MALLHAAYLLSKEDLDFKFSVAHVNHKLRAASDEDASFVQKEAADRGLPFFFTELSTPPASNIEAWARDNRYRFFKETCEAHTLVATLTAHTMNDVVETFLMRLVANKEPRLISKKDERRKIIRPMLEIRREQILEFIKDHQIAYREDESNRDSKFLRNRVRNELIAFLGNTFEGDPIATFYDRAQSFAEDTEYFDAKVVEISSDIKEPFGLKSWLLEMRKHLGELPRALQWRLIEEIFLPICGFRIGRNWGHRVAEFLRGDHVGIELPGGKMLRKKNGGITI